MGLIRNIGHGLRTRRCTPVNKRPRGQGPLSETVEYYGTNIRQGVSNGSKISMKAGHTKFRTFFTKLYCGLKNVKVRKQDILPLSLAGIGNLIPFPGAAPAGYYAGFGINKLYRYLLAQVANNPFRLFKK